MRWAQFEDDTPWPESGTMKRVTAKVPVFAAGMVGLYSSTVSADTPKERKVRSGTTVAVVNLKPDCSAVPRPVAMPSLHEKPASGTMLVQILVTDVAASGNSPVRKIPAISLSYSPYQDLVGIDAQRIDVEVGNRTTSLSCRLMVSPAAQSLSSHALSTTTF
jgi:hypothetical protein